METLANHSTANNSALKIIVSVLFIVLPFVGFYLGMQYQASIAEPTPILTSPIRKSTQYQTSDTANWKSFNFDLFKLSFKYPPNWYQRSGAEGCGPIFGPNPNESNIGGLNLPYIAVCGGGAYGIIDQSSLPPTPGIASQGYIDKVKFIKSKVDLSDVRPNDSRLTILFQTYSFLPEHPENLIVYTFGPPSEITPDFLSTIDQILSTFKFTDQKSVSDKREVTIPVILLPTRHGIEGQFVQPHYLKTISLSVPSALHADLSAYAGDQTEDLIVAPAGWTGTAIVGADGNTYLHLNPSDTQKDKASINVAFTHSGVALMDAAPYFPWIQEHWQDINLAPITPTPIPGLKNNFVTPNVNKYSITNSPNGFEVNGVIYSNVQSQGKNGAWLANKIEVTLSSNKHDLALFIIDDFIDRQELLKK